MSQSSIIGATLLAGFILFLAANDRLQVYASVLWGDTKAPLPSSQPSTSGAIPGPGGGGGGGFGLPDLLGGTPGAGGGFMSLLESAGPELLLLAG